LRNYEITYQPFKDSFLLLSRQGVPLHIILENQIYNAYQNFFKQLQTVFSGEEQIHLQSDDAMGTTYQHSKVMFNESAFRIQTANLTKSSFEFNREHFFFSEHSAVLRSLSQLFARDLAGEQIKNTDLHPNLVVCPINCRSVVENLLRSAEESIIMQTQYILDDRILEILRSQSEKIKLNIIVADTLDNTDVVHYF
jgi:phosphatidylserine/phosphatidylglycerophosphate/cardiolipin synthase-like enzyme